MSEESEKVKEECKVCKFVFAKNKENLSMGQHAVSQNYFCRRYPPTEQGIIQVAANGWCGEYKPVWRI